ncbi:Oidioi.mRNA.OKI2018_I69.PAR.g10212.t1.cds [Oikopleura dioica]|uniref:Oidioi.mRNA.OKI2018_I69.PAR.g10212.t1.cds n=1 Tax=Oikopleura dioica TaxID=34765 RepID=A0ABN7RTS7_OIKDI|nr:Oidioi.mRNA.OKI2018_I69.PAR.g10212.t1.cds [Oikopleura dioica]
MDDLNENAEQGFVIDEVNSVIKESIENVVGSSQYESVKIDMWMNSIIEQCIENLTKLDKPYKYVATAVIMQKTGAGLQTSSSCYWDSTTDGSCTVRWENKTMYCIVSVFGLKI